MNAEKELQERTRFLRNAAPQEFGAFITAFEHYARAVADDLLWTDQLVLAQGRAQQCRKIFDLLSLKEAKSNG